MTTSSGNSHNNKKPYVPATLSEIYDLLSAFYGEPPKFIDESGFFPDQNIDTRFYQLTEGMARTRSQLGEERYRHVLQLAAHAKALFLEDPEEDNGKTAEGLKLVYEIEDVIQAVRRKRVDEKIKDDEGEVTGD